MRVGMLTTSFPRHEGDVAGCFVLSHALQLAREGHQVDVLAPEPCGGDRPDLAAGVALEWVPYLRPRAWQRTFYGAGAPDNLRRDPRAWLGALPFTAALLGRARARAQHWDALISHWALPCALIAGHLRGPRPHTAVLHSADLHLLSRLPGRAVVASAIARGATELRFVSQHGRMTFTQLLPDAERGAAAARMRVEAMPIDSPSAPTESREALRRKLGMDRPTLLFMGRLVPIKGLDGALRALAPRADLQLVVAGEGPERRRLEQTAARGNLAVRFVGAVHGPQREALFRAADALLLPSRPEPGGRTEGAPLVVREAAARGLPVIASRTGGIPECLEPRDLALLFEPGDASSLRAAVARWLSGMPSNASLG